MRFFLNFPVITKTNSVLFCVLFNNSVVNQNRIRKLKASLLSRFLAYLLFRIFVGVLVLIYRWAIIHVYDSIIAILLYFDDMIDIK